MLVWAILFVYSINADQPLMRQMEFEVLSNSYFNTTDTSSVLLQQRIPGSVSASIDCSRLCMTIGSSCSRAVYNNTNQICTIYSTTIGTQQPSSCCSTFINTDSGASVTLPSNVQVSSVSSLHTARAFHTATLLSSGRVLVAGGRNSSAIFSSCELYFPGSQNWSTIASMNTPRVRHTATLLTMNNTDLVFVIGGYYTTGNNPLSSVEYYNTSSNTWTMTNPMTNARYSHSTTVLNNGHWLVAGGTDSMASLTSTEIFYPNTSTWQIVGSLNIARLQHMDALLDNGNVFIAGGSDLSNSLQSCEIFDINLQTWSLVSSLTSARNLGSLVSLLPITHSLLIIGGSGGAGTAYSSTDLYYPATNTITSSSDMTYQRFCHSSNLMYYGSTPLVVVAGGYDSSYTGTNSVQFFIVQNSTWINIKPMNSSRGQHTATLLNTFPPSLLIVGGRTDFFTTSMLKSVELFIF